MVTIIKMGQKLCWWKSSTGWMLLNGNEKTMSYLVAHITFSNKKIRTLKGLMMVFTLWAFLLRLWSWNNIKLQATFLLLTFICRCISDFNTFININNCFLLGWQKKQERLTPFWRKIQSYQLEYKNNLFNEIHW